MSPTTSGDIFYIHIRQKKASAIALAYGVGKLPTSRRYNQLPLLRSSPGGFARSWPYRTYPYVLTLSTAKVRKNCDDTNIIWQKLFLNHQIGCCIRRKSTLYNRYYTIFCIFANRNTVSRSVAVATKGKGGKSGQHRALHFLTESCL